MSPRAYAFAIPLATLMWVALYAAGAAVWQHAQRGDLIVLAKAITP